jgi:Xaa-Pro aminopeptidase
VIDENGLDALLVSQAENRRYLSGFTGSSGWLLISEQHAILATDSRYTEQASEEALDFEVVQVKGELHNWLPDLVSDLGWHKLGFEASFVPYDSYRKLMEAIKARQLHLGFIPTTNLVEHLRMVKEPEELELITEAAELIDTAFEYIKSLIHPGMEEREAAWEIEKFLRQQGSEGMPFDPIVASGPNSALPHIRPTRRTIHPGEPVLIDIGARISGYCSDFSRTLCLEKELKAESYQLSAIYNIVSKAQTTAIEGIESGMDASQVDQLARTIIKQAGYGDAFGHNLGHGVGLAVHELPMLASNSSESLIDGMVFTIEPGIYIPGWGGVRIEDMVVLENGKAKLLTRSEKDRFQLSAIH